MRVLHLTSGNLFGGVESMLVTMARYREACPEMTHSFALCFDGRLQGELEASGVDVHSLGNVRLSRVWTVWRARQRLQEVLERQRFDWMICHSVWPLVVFGPVLERHAGWLGYWQHNMISGRHWLERWARLYTPRLAICNSHVSARTLCNLFSRTPPNVVCYPTVAEPEVSGHESRGQLRARMNVSAVQVVIVQVSRMEASKGHRLHFEALSRLRDLDNWVCWQVGGPQRPKEYEYFEGLKRAVDELGIAERVRFLGDRSDVSALLAAADIHCQPNIDPEPFGLTFVEAMYAGLPVVTTAIGSVTEILDSACAHLVAPGNPAALGDALRGLISNPGLRGEMGRRGPRQAERISHPKYRMPQLFEALHSHSMN